MNRLDNLQQLGRYVREQREALQQTLSETALHAGISRETLARIERVESERLAADTLYGLDVALHWPTGTARAIYDRGAAGFDQWLVRQPVRRALDLVVDHLDEHAVSVLLVVARSLADDATGVEVDEVRYAIKSINYSATDWRQIVAPG